MIKAVAITVEAFRPFGALVTHGKGVALAVVSDAFEHHPDATIPALEWVHPQHHVTLPVSVDRVERHPFSAQTFLPHLNSPFLVVVCAAKPDGSPDPSSAMAFLVPPEIGVTFGRNVWHRSLAPLVTGSGYTMSMMRTGRDDDTVFWDMAEPIQVIR